MSQDLTHWFVLQQVPKFGIASLRKLTERTQLSVQQIFALPPEQLADIGFNPEQITAICQPSKIQQQQSLRWLEGGDNRFILSLDSPEYPELLKQISTPPILLYGYGSPSSLNRYQIAMVGSRNPSEHGKQSAHDFAHQLSQFGWVVTSGLAMGIDGFAHKGALQGKHVTIAVLGTAIDKMYPKRHVSLAEQILDNDGVIISEFAPGTPSRPENFPRRNRIISGLSVGTLIVEAAIKSGSLITAKYALEQNREVFAIPGNIHNPVASGCNFLIKQGAKLVTCPEDITEEFGLVNLPEITKNPQQVQINPSQSLESDVLLDSVDYEVTPIDMVAKRSGISIDIVMSKLLEYELCGLVSAVSGGYIKLGEK